MNVYLETNFSGKMFDEKEIKFDVCDRSVNHKLVS
jgi:hypothetical protein